MILCRRTLLRAGGLIAAPAIIGRALAQIPQTGGGKAKPGAVSAAAMSLVLANASNQYLTRTWGNTPTDATKLTISLWFKNVTLNVVPSENWWYTTAVSSARIFSTRYSASSQNYGLVDNSSSAYSIVGGAGLGQDTTTWHHFCLKLDSNQITDAARGQLYIDGTEVSYNSQTSILLETWQATPNTITSFIGQISFNPGVGSPDIKYAYFYLIDGQALTPSSFTTGTGSGTTHPVAYGGTFGTNGFFMNFSGSNTNDQSGNANNWTQVNAPTFSADVPT